MGNQFKKFRNYSEYNQGNNQGEPRWKPSNATNSSTYPRTATAPSNRPNVQPPPPPPKPIILIAIFPYESTGDGDISFKAGDLMILKNDSNPDWALVQHTVSNEIGYAPKGFFAQQESLQKEEWYVGNLPRMDAVKLLLENGLPNGTYLVRERDQGDFALSIRYKNPETSEVEIRHYKIRKTNDNRYCISPKNIFNSLHELIERYKEKGLCCPLTTPCPKSLPRLYDISPRTQENYEIPKSDLRMIKLLGQGYFGEVWYAKWKGHTEVAVKMLKTNSGMTRDNFLAEAKIMKECRHKNLVSLLGVCTSEEPICILTEYMSNGNLLKYLQTGEGKTLEINVLIDMCAQVAKGMSYLEENHIVHRDLAARNVLVGDKEGAVPSVRVADFGLAKMFNEDYAVYISQPGGKLPIKWTAPEALLNNTFSVKSDVWSYGILLYEIFTRGQTPYPGMTGGQVVDKLKEGYRMPRPQNCPDPLYEIMKRCWAQEPEKRDTFDFLFTFFDDYIVFTERPYDHKTND